ncbi:MAG: hypothetical protein IVW55_14500 [Chloroflexi bacterium]|nr:hypothetical protein [Chloroflexota bacterium]
MAELLWLERDLVIEKIKLLRGANLRPLAEQCNITIFKPEGGFNKGWVDHMLEAYLGLPRNSLRAGDFVDANGSWELKTVALFGKALHPDGKVPVQRTAWYDKSEATFSDVLAEVRRHLWGNFTFQTSPTNPDVCLVPRSHLERLAYAVCY